MRSFGSAASVADCRTKWTWICSPQLFSSRWVPPLLQECAIRFICLCHSEESSPGGTALLACELAIFLKQCFEVLSTSAEAWYLRSRNGNDEL